VDVASLPTSQTRKATPAEIRLINKGLPEGARKLKETSIIYVEKGKRVTSKSGFATNRQHRAKRAEELYGEALPPEKLAKEHREGTRPYLSADSERRAIRQRETRSVDKRIGETAKARASAHGFGRGKRQTRKVLDRLEQLNAQHERYLQTGRGMLPEEEYREAAELMFRYYGPDDERTRRMQMSYSVGEAAA